MQAIYVAADDITDPGPPRHTTFAHLAATHGASRPDLGAGHLPCGGTRRDSTSRSSTLIHRQEVTTTPRRRVKRILQRYNELQDIIAILGHRRAAERTRFCAGRARRIQRFALPEPAGRRAVHRQPGSVVPLSRRSSPSGRSPTATTTTCREQRSSSAAASRTSRRRPPAEPVGRLHGGPVHCGLRALRVSKQRPQSPSRDVSASAGTCRSVHA